MEDFVCELSEGNKGFTTCAYDGVITLTLTHYERVEDENAVIFEFVFSPFLAVFHKMNESEFLSAFEFGNPSLSLKSVTVDTEEGKFRFVGSLLSDLAHDPNIVVEFTQPIVEVKELNFFVHYGTQQPYIYSSLRFQISKIIRLFSYITAIFCWVSFLVGV